MLIINRRDADVARLYPYEIRIGNNVDWRDNSVCGGGELKQSDYPIGCNMHGRYVFIVLK
jgi:hypothetical protein